MYHNYRVALLVDSKERAYLKNFHEMLKNAKHGTGGQTVVDESHLERLENSILIHIDIKGKNCTRSFGHNF